MVNSLLQNETSVIESASRLTAIIEHAIDGIITINTQGIIESVNPSAAIIFGYSPDEIIGEHITTLIPQGYQNNDQYLKIYDDAQEGTTFGTGREVFGKRKNGEIFPFLLSISEVKVKDIKIFTGIIHDLSQLKKTEEALRTSEVKFNAIINAAVDGIITINESGIMEMVNPAATRIFGYSEEEMLGRNVSILMTEPERSEHDSYMEDYCRTGVRKIIGLGREVTAIRKDGTTFPIYLSVSELNINGQRVFTGFIYDITDQKMAEEKLRRYASELERSNSELQDFAYVSSHDLQEPLRKIQAFGDLLVNSESGRLSDEGKDYLSRIINAASRMQNLINDLLNFSRVASKAQPFVIVDLDKILKEVLSDIEILINKTEAKIEFDKLPEIEGDATQIRQLFQNLIVNSIKFRKENEVPVIKISFKRIYRKASMRGLPGDEFIEIYFQDNGMGFDEKYVDRIFNIFQRLEGKKYEGSGIGLAVCRKIAIRHGGNITAKSKPGKGATFIVSLAAKQPKEEKVL